MNATPPPPVRAFPWSVVLDLPGAPRARTVSLAGQRAQMMGQRRLAWIGAQACAALLLLLTRIGTMPWQPLLCWGAMVFGTCALALLGHRRSRVRGSGTWRDIDTIAGLLFALAWTIALTLFDGGSGAAELGGFLLVGALAIAATMLTAPAPLGGLIFIGVAGTGAAAAAMLSWPGAALVASIPPFVLAVLLALAFNARGLLRRIAAESAVGEKDRLISLLLREFEDTGSDWLWRIDAGRCLIDVSQRVAIQFGRARAEIEGKQLVALIAGEGWENGRVAPAVRELADRLMRRESFRDFVVPVTVGEEKRWWSLSAAPRRDEDGQLIGFWGVGTDVTERHRSSERIDRMARFDALTSLANRAHVIEALGESLREGHRLGRRSALMLIDLDRFKQINDTLGHPIGDRLLIEVAGRLRTLVGGGDVCGRLGGDEFAVVLPDATDRDRIETIAETIVSTLSAPYEIEGHRLHIGASVGSATAPRDGRVVETLLRNADLALYRAKDDGRGIHRRYEPHLHAAADERRRIEAGLRDALELGQFRLVYQPIVEAADGRLTGFEALLRWTHPELGQVSPDVFIPVAEEARLIGRIGDWVMHTACREAARWADGIRVSVNMAAAQIKDPQLPATIVTALSHSGLAPDRLELEIAETVFVRGGDAVGVAVDKLLSLGVRLSLADYSTGPSTGFLRKGRFSSVKIDRSFVRGVGANAPESIAIVRAIVALADSLGMATIAEGAETQYDYDRMEKLGCARIQGWMVGQPLDADAARRLAGGDATAKAVA